MNGVLRVDVWSDIACPWCDIDQAHAFGISGVPFFVIDGRLGVSGAQSPDVFARALAQAEEGAADDGR